MQSNGSICLVTVDGTDFLIDEPTPFSKKWSSHKFGKHAALRYEIGICIQTGWIVWVNGPYPAGQWPDLAISRDCLNQSLGRKEKFLADGGHRDKHGWSNRSNGCNARQQCMEAVAGAWHECVNGHFKVFGVFDRNWRQHRKKHGVAFMAAANIVQARIQLEPTVLKVMYHDRLKKHLKKHRHHHHHHKHHWNKWQ